MIRAVIFDMDGLMFDTEHLAAEGWKRAGAELGFDIDESRLSQIRGRNIASSRKLFNEWYGEQVDYDRARSIRCSYSEDYIKKFGMPVKAGLYELIFYLDVKGYKKAVATSTNRETVEKYFLNADIRTKFDAVICGDEITNSKPAPDAFLAAASKLQVESGNCLVLEDSPNGIRAGVNAGCSVIMIPDMDAPTTELKGMCTGVCTDLSKVITVLEKMR